jgi:hypothetical protein
VQQMNHRRQASSALLRNESHKNFIRVQYKKPMVLFYM